MSNELNINNYASNGRSGESINIKATQIKSKNKEYQTTNGKFFNNAYNKELLNNNIISTTQKIEKKKIVSWIVDTLNPINHIPLINTLKNLNKSKKSSLDMVQSAIGGIIYGGGVGGIAKGLGGWFARKLLPKNIIASNSKIENNKGMAPINNGRIINNNSNIKKVNLKETDFQSVVTENHKINKFNKNIFDNSNKIDIIHIKKSNKNHYELYDKSKKIISKTIDTKA